ncbi:MAG: tyrosine-type recombinase/integrase [Caldisericaceae bacterium]
MSANLELKTLEYSFFKELSSNKKLSSNTTLAYKSDIQKFVSFIEQKGIVYLQDLDEAVLMKYFGQKSFLNSQSTFRRNISSVRYFLRFARQKSGIDLLVLVKGIHSAKVAKKPRQIISPSEIKGLLENMPEESFISKRNKLIMLMIYTTGIQASELCNLRLSDVNLQEKCIIVGGKAKRKIIFSELLHSYLSDYIIERAAMLPQNQAIENNVFFLSNTFSKLTRQSIYLIVKKYSEKVGQRVSPRTLRNSVLAHLIEDGADEEVLKQAFGYKSNVPDRSDFISGETGGSSAYLSSNPILRKK